MTTKRTESEKTWNGRETDAIVARCTRAEYRIYCDLRERATNVPDGIFARVGYVVADASTIKSKRTGRRKAHFAQLVQKQIIVALDKSRSRSQRYLLGCICDNVVYFASWLDQIFAAGERINLLDYEAPGQAPHRAMRPTRTETPQSLMDKRFVSFRPELPSLYTLHTATPQSIRDREASRRPVAKADRPAIRREDSTVRSERIGTRKQTERDRQIQRLAEELSKLSGGMPNLQKADRTVWGQLLDYYGFERVLQIVHLTWDNRDRIVSTRWPNELDPVSRTIC